MEPPVLHGGRQVSHEPDRPKENALECVAPDIVVRGQDLARRRAADAHKEAIQPSPALDHSLSQAFRKAGVGIVAGQKGDLVRAFAQGALRPPGTSPPCGQ